MNIAGIPSEIATILNRQYAKGYTLLFLEPVPQTTWALIRRLIRHPIYTLRAELPIRRANRKVGWKVYRVEFKESKS